MPENSAQRWMSLRAVLRHEPEMERLGVSTVARSARGFLSAYKAGRTAAVTKTMLAQPGQTWGQRRAAFIARHLPQWRANPTERRRLALIAWAHMPD